MLDLREESNLSIRFLHLANETIECYDGRCAALAHSVLKRFGNVTDSTIEIVAQTEYLNYTAKDGRVQQWRWHAVPLINGVVHDAWFPDLILTPYSYLNRAFPNQKVIGRLLGGWRDGDGVST